MIDDQDQSPAVMMGALMEFAGLPAFKPSRRRDPMQTEIQMLYDRVLGDKMRMEEQTARVEACATWSAKWWKALEKLDRLNAGFLYRVQSFQRKVILR